MSHSKCHWLYQSSCPAVQPRLKKPHVDPSLSQNYRPISKLTFNNSGLLKSCCSAAYTCPRWTQHCWQFSVWFLSVALKQLFSESQMISWCTVMSECWYYRVLVLLILWSTVLWLRGSGSGWVCLDQPWSGPPLTFWTDVFQLLFITISLYHWNAATQFYILFKTLHNCLNSTERFLFYPHPSSICVPSWDADD